jgi:dTDP-4-amino-4,6-dideoxygalactose transaminase
MAYSYQRIQAFLKPEEINLERMSTMEKKKIPFSPPDITEEEIQAVTEVMRSGWITSGPKNAEFSSRIKEYLNVNYALPVSSATAAMELPLKAFSFGGDDEVISTPYTYTATASVVTHRGIKPKFIDVKKDSFFMDYDKLYDAITPKTRAIFTVDVAGVPADYDKVKEIVKAKGREDIMLVSDSAHSFGASYKGQKVGSQFHFHSFSFHAVKNLTTAEGGAITFNDNNLFGKEDLIKEFTVTSLHGQSKDALSKMKLGAWRYDIINDGLKCNMTDINAAIGLVQLKRYEGLLKKREAIFDIYTKKLSEKDWAITPFKKDSTKETSYHLYLLRIKDFREDERNRLIEMLAEEGIATNVHYMPLPMFTFYKSIGYDIKDYPNAYAQYANEITLPLYSKLSLEDAEYVVDHVIEFAEKIMKER